MSTMSEVAFLLGGNQVKVLTTSGRGFTPEEVAERALDKIISVGEEVFVPSAQIALHIGVDHPGCQ